MTLQPDTEIVDVDVLLVEDSQPDVVLAVRRLTRDWLDCWSDRPAPERLHRNADSPARSSIAPTAGLRIQQRSPMVGDGILPLSRQETFAALRLCHAHCR
jgi:hypothetical protein